MPLRNRVKEGAEKRNKMAHSHATRTLDEETGDIAPALTTGRAKPVMSKADLERAVTEFEELMADLIAFAGEIGKVTEGRASGK